MIEGSPPTSLFFRLYLSVTEKSRWHPQKDLAECLKVSQATSSNTTYPVHQKWSGLQSKADKSHWLAMYACSPNDLAHFVFPYLEGETRKRDFGLSTRGRAKTGKYKSV